MPIWVKTTFSFLELRDSNGLHSKEVRMIIVLVIVLGRDPRSRS